MPRSEATQHRTRAPHLGPERRRPQALDAALDIAAECGVDAVTLSAVADRMRVTRPVVYSCYPNRIELLQALLERESEQILQAVLVALHGAKGGDPEATFVNGYRALLHVVAERPQSWRLLFTDSPEPELARHFAHSRKEIAANAARWIGPVLSRWWGVRDVERKLPVLVELFMSSCEASIRLALSRNNEWSLDELGEFCGRAMCRALSGA